MYQHVAVIFGCVSMAIAGQIPLNVLLAQTSAPPVSGSAELFWRVADTLGSMGILAWYFYRTQTKTIPEKDAQMKTERDAATLERQSERQSHEAAVASVVGELRAEREARMKIIEMLNKDK